MSKFDLNDSYYSIFVKETNEQLESMEHDFIELEAGEYDDEILNNIFRCAHSMKSACAAVEFMEMSQIAHALESLLTKLKNKETEVSSDLMDVLFSTLDELKSMFQALCKGEEYNIDVSSIENRINDYLGKDKNIETASKIQWAENELETGRKIDKSFNIYKIVITIEKQSDFKALKAVMAVKELNKYGTVEYVSPEDYENIEDENFGDTISIIFSTKENSYDFVKKLKSITDVSKVEFDKFIDKIVSKVNKTNKTKESKNEISSIKVDIERINKLINLAGEFVIEKEVLNKISNQLRIRNKRDPLIERLVDSLVHINYIGSELQETILSTRMLPLEYIFNRFPRIVRDLAVKCEKEVELSIEGSETEIDRAMIEMLIDPITHILRNTVDHGIEKPEERKKKGKNETGKVSIKARHQESRVIIDIEDDGNGIDVDLVRKKAVEKNIISKETINQMTETEIIQLIFEPGFSTSETVSEISGRGVGMDVVKSNISNLNGIVEVKTEKDKGTIITIKLPLTLAIIKAILVKEGEFTFAIPISFIIEIERLKGDELENRIYTIADMEVFSWRNQAISVLRLASYFDIELNKLYNKAYVIVVGYSEKRIAIIVDEIYEEQEIVIKSMEEYIGENKLMGLMSGISGASILGDGSFAHVIDIPALSREFYSSRKEH